MKVLLALLVVVGTWMTVSVAHAQMGTACIGCMPRTGPVFDSTMTTPAPSFSTTAGTGDVYIPPREVIVTVPGPVVVTPPAWNDPDSFHSTQFTCAAGGVGNDGARGAVLALYKDLGGRCADEGGLAFWATTLVNCIATRRGWPTALGMDTGAYSAFTSDPCQIEQGMGNLSSDQSSMDGKCAEDASTRGFATMSYRYIRGRDSDLCKKI
jgi:hypothetical protein